MLRKDRRRQRLCTALDNLEKAIEETQELILCYEQEIIDYKEGRASMSAPEGIIRKTIQQLMEKQKRQNYEKKVLASRITPITGGAKTLQDSAIREEKDSAYGLTHYLNDMDKGNF